MNPDARTPAEIDRELAELQQAARDGRRLLDYLSSQVDEVCEQRDRYRAALEEIARHESGVWGTIAAEALKRG